MLKKDTITDVINYCNRDIVPDAKFDPKQQYPSIWFEDFFDFLGNASLKKHLGEAYYNARFVYKLMSALQLKRAKHIGIVKFQIIQYASICEAILDFVIDKHFLEDFITLHSTDIYKEQNQALPNCTKILHNGKELLLCTKTKKAPTLKLLSAAKKSEYACAKKIISAEICEKYKNLYDIRNNVHILKAHQSSYCPKVKESADAFQLMNDLVSEIKKYVLRNPLV